MSALKTLPARPLGRNGPLVPRLGLGLMGLSGQYGYSAPEAERLHFLDEAYKRGQWFWDTADKYGDSEDIIGKWFAENPEKRKDIFLATKFGIKYTDTAPGFTIDSSPAYCRTSIESSLNRLGLPFVDLYYVHRLDKVTPIEKTMEVMLDLKTAGKIKNIGLSECSAESLRRAHAIHPITCVQIEYSLFCTEIESPHRKLLETARELGVAIVAYSPLANGILAGNIHKVAESPEDKRRVLPWLQEGNIEKNVAIVDQISEVANAKNATLPQLALAWLLAQGDDIFPIPGSSKIDRLESNLESLSISLSKEEEAHLRQLTQGVAGGRFQNLTRYAFGDTPALEE
ncbi:Aldo/keto reductase [Penicillium cosmopolitanum]|uniref:Aldo/keto reductase n=1 Tax=Penicillium cosmopolitanum TaxID=1131564 RepID=A0A9W9VYE0_9EURO|nr:Aldo/keto reductase [Penicillium cosmopolitanum]KAJ5391692.1 Aldo/keto reductase [Penicillium cosmopolitanum]